MSQIFSLKAMKDFTLSEGRHPGDPIMTPRAVAWLNEKMVDLAEKLNLADLLTRIRVSITTNAPADDLEAPQEMTQLPRDVVRIEKAMILNQNVTPSKWSPLEIVPLREFQSRFYSQTFTAAPGMPSAIALQRIESARKDFATLVGIRVQSTVTEQAALTVSVEAYTDAKHRTSAKYPNTTIINATPQALNAGATHYGILQVSKSDASLGMITITSNNGDVLAQIMPWEMRPIYVVMATFPYADKAYTADLLYTRRPSLMTLDSDTAGLLPNGAVQVMMDYTVARILRFIEDSDWVQAAQMAQKAEDDLILKANIESVGESHVEWQDGESGFVLGGN